MSKSFPINLFSLSGFTYYYCFQLLCCSCYNQWINIWALLLTKVHTLHYGFPLWYSYPQVWQMDNFIRILRTACRIFPLPHSSRTPTELTLDLHYHYSFAFLTSIVIGLTSSDYSCCLYIETIVNTATTPLCMQTFVGHTFLIP